MIKQFESIKIGDFVLIKNMLLGSVRCERVTNVKNILFIKYFETESGRFSFEGFERSRIPHDRAIKILRDKQSRKVALGKFIRSKELTKEVHNQIESLDTEIFSNQDMLFVSEKIEKFCGKMIEIIEEQKYFIMDKDNEKRPI